MLSKIVKDVMIDKILCSSPTQPSELWEALKSTWWRGSRTRPLPTRWTEYLIYLCTTSKLSNLNMLYSQPPILGQRSSKKLLEFSAKFKLTTQKTPKLHYISMNFYFHWFLYFFRQVVWPEKWSPQIFPLLDQFADLSVQTQFGFWLIFLLN